MGLEKYDRMDPNHVCFSVMYNDSYMYSAANHTGYVLTNGSNQKVGVFRSQNIRLLVLTGYVSLSVMHFYIQEYDNELPRRT